MDVTEHGLYIVKDSYFDEFVSPGWIWTVNWNCGSVALER